VWVLSRSHLVVVVLLVLVLALVLVVVVEVVVSGTLCVFILLVSSLWVALFYFVIFAKTYFHVFPGSSVGDVPVTHPELGFVAAPGVTANRMAGIR
jgi:hypothetical protein